MAEIQYVGKTPVPNLVKKLSKLNDYIAHDFIGGPRPLKLAWVINFQKFGTFFFVAALMFLFDNYETAAWVYLGLHGSYGFCWLLKHFAFPDRTWEVFTTIPSSLMAFLVVLGPYWIAPLLLITGVLGSSYQYPSNEILATAIFIHTLGAVIMMSADAQKHYTLQIKKGLITTGLFKYIRHPNYLGEMMIYGSYALIVGHWIPWAILGYIWIFFFGVNIWMKESSMSRYPEWADYKKRTKLLIPFVI